MEGNWSWTEMCGPGGLIPWNPTKRDLGICFQQIFLHVPVLVLFAISSAYYYGSSSERRNTFRREKCIVQLRFTFSLLLTLVSVVKIVTSIQYASQMIRPVDYLTAGVEIITWFIHSGYVLCLRHDEKIHGPIIVRVLWTLLLILSIINLRSQVLTSHSESDTVYCFNLAICIAVVTLQVFYGLTFLLCNQRTQSNLEELHRRTQYNEQSHLLSSSTYRGFMEDLDPGYLSVAMENESFTSKLIFYWVYPLMKKGSERKLQTCDDLFDLPHQLSTSYLSRKLHAAMSSDQKSEEFRMYGSTDVRVLPKPEKVSLFKALHSCFGMEFYSIGVLKLFEDLLSFGGPLLLNRLINFIENKSEKVEIGYFCALGLFATTFFRALLNVHFNFFMAKVGIKIRGALISTIYIKTLNTKFLDLNRFSLGEIVNFMSTDTDRIVNSCPSFHSFWSIPLQIIVTFYLLYKQVGISFLVGVLFSVILIPINKVVAAKIGKLSLKLMEEKDRRVTLTAETLQGIRVLKFHVWEEYFMEKILKVRHQELRHLKARKYLDALCVYFWATTPIIISVLTFATYSLMGNPLNAATVFTTMALLNMLISPLNAFPWILNGLTEAWVSLKRIQKLMDSENVNFRDYFDADSDNEEIVYELKDCSFQWGIDGDHGEKVSDENFGDEKFSSHQENSSLSINECEATCSLEAENQIESKKHFVLDSVNLTIFEGHLIGVIGPVGSGKSTLLAALIGEIQKVGGTIKMKNFPGGCALVTQTPWVQRGTIRENILFGKSFDAAWYKTVVEACCLTHDFENFPAGDLAKVGEGGMTLSGGQRARLALARAVYQNKDIYLLDDVLASVDVNVSRTIYSKVICGLLKDKTRILCTNRTRLLFGANLIVKLNGGTVEAVGTPAEILSDYDKFSDLEMESSLPVVDYKAKPVKNVKSLNDFDAERSEIGGISGKVYRKYWISVGHFLAIVILSSLVMMQASRNLTDCWLSFWVSIETKLNLTRLSPISDSGVRKNSLTVYAVLAVSNTIFTLLRSFLFAYGGIQAAVAVHESLLKKILSSKIVFFDISPLGRILNRFSSDTYAVDDCLPFVLNIFLAQLFGLLGSIFVTAYELPWICLVLAPLVPVYQQIQATYRSASRELKRLYSTSLSPVFGHFSETLEGLTSIRAFRAVSRFKQTNQELLECNQKAVFASQAASQWLGFQLQMIGVVLVTGVGIIGVLQHEFDVVDSAIIGLTISYALSTTSLLNGVVSSFTETEKEMISMERIGQYLDEIDSEPESGNSPPYGWLSQGVIVFQGVYLRYREHIPPSLNGISFETRPAEKIGIVGRTGAGKSSLIVALLRLVDVFSGNILIDAVNIKQISLQGLRSRISVIPQDPFLFEGSIRSNIDPLNEYSDSEISRVLEKCHVKDVVDKLGGLAAKICSGGKNFSQGERQLLCLARAVLRNAKIVCVDEATAFVDAESDKKIQHTLRSSFRQSTVLTIAHRISTVMDCDRILVLHDGEVVEFDTPKILVEDENSYFYQLYQHEIE